MSGIEVREEIQHLVWGSSPATVFPSIVTDEAVTLSDLAFAYFVAIQLYGCYLDNYFEKKASEKTEKITEAGEKEKEPEKLATAKVRSLVNECKTFVNELY